LTGEGINEGLDWISDRIIGKNNKNKNTNKKQKHSTKMSEEDNEIK